MRRMEGIRKIWRRRRRKRDEGNEGDDEDEDNENYNVLTLQYECARLHISEHV